MNTRPVSHRSKPTKPTQPDSIVGEGEMVERIRAYDWTTTGLGPISGWPQSLLTAVNLMIQSPVPIVMLWGPDGRMIYNDAYAIFAGGRHPQLLGSKVVDGWPEVADFNRNVMAHGLQGKTLSYKDQQLTLYRNDIPEEVWMDLNYSPIIDETGKPGGVLAIVVETTQRVLAEQRQKQAEEALKAEQERLQSLFMQAPAMIAVLHGPEHVFEMANPMYVNTVAANRDIIGKPLIEAMPELKGQSVIGILDKVLRTGKPYAGQLTIKIDRYGTGTLEDAHFNLVYQPINSVPGTDPDGIFVHAVDITEQIVNLKRAEELSAQLEAVFDSMPDGIYIAQEGSITRMNQRGAESLGFDSPDDVPRSLEALYKTLSMQQLHDGRPFTLADSTLGQALQGKTVQHIGVEITNPRTGAKQIIRTAGAPIRNKKGEIIGAVAINNDLTEQYHMQEKMQKEVLRRRLLAQKTKLLRQQNSELTKLNATKNEFIALTSHQLRTPATGVKQYIAMLLQGYAGPITPEQEQFLDRAYESNERQLHIIEDILRVAKVDMGKTQIQKQDYNVASLVQNVLNEQAERFAEHHQTIATHFPKEPIIAHLDASQLHMAIGNIVDNAIKYTPDDKRITVRLQQLDNNTLELKITDQGVGIAKQDLDKLFQKFSRIPNPRSIMVGGTGLGLYWTQRIIELHGGTITVRSRLGIGTTFSIRLPIRET